MCVVGDMYGLGMVLLELYQKEDFMAKRKQDPLSSWCIKNDPGNTILWLWNQNLKGDEMCEEWKSLCQKCLHMKHFGRPSIGVFKSQWDQKVRPKYAPAETGK